MLYQGKRSAKTSTTYPKLCLTHYLTPPTLKEQMELVLPLRSTKNHIYQRIQTNILACYNKMISTTIKIICCIALFLLLEVTALQGNKPVVTLVSAFWNVNRGNLKRFNRPVQYYMNFFESQLKTKSNMIIYGDQKLQEFVWKRRNKTNTLFILRSLSETSKMWHTPMIQQIIAKFKTNPVFWQQSSQFPQYALEMYNAIVMTKLFLMEQAVQKDIFNTDFMVWSDAGLLHNYSPAAFVPQNILQNYQMLFQGSWYFHFYTDNNMFRGYENQQLRYVSKLIPKNQVVLANYFGGRVEVVSTMKSVYQNFLRITLSFGDLGTDESVFTMMCVRFPYLIPLNVRHEMVDLFDKFIIKQRMYLTLQNDRMFSLIKGKQLSINDQQIRIKVKNQQIALLTQRFNILTNQSQIKNTFITKYFNQAGSRLKFTFMFKVLLNILLLYSVLMLKKLKNKLINQQKKRIKSAQPRLLPQTKKLENNEYITIDIQDSQGVVHPNFQLYNQI